MSDSGRLTPERAVRRGILLINVPVAVLSLLFSVIGFRVGERIGFVFAFVGLLLGAGVGFIAGWLWWSFAIPRWRDWVIDSGLDPNDVQSLAEQARLLWPLGSRYEHTEFLRRNGTRGW